MRRLLRITEPSTGYVHYAPAPLQDAVTLCGTKPPRPRYWTSLQHRLTRRPERFGDLVQTYRPADLDRVPERPSLIEQLAAARIFTEGR